MSQYLFTGSNHYILSQQIHTWVQQFQQKYGKQAYYHFDSQNFDVKNIIEALSNNSLFQEKKMLVITGIPADKHAENKISTSKIEELLQRYETYQDRISTDTMILRVSIDPDKRTRGYKYLSTHCQIKEFKPFTPKELQSWVQDTIGSIVDHTGAQSIIDMIGNDMYRLENEIHKLSQFAQAHHIPKLTLADIHKIVRSQEDENVFGLLYKIIYHADQAYEELSIAQHSGVDRNKYHGGLMRGLRSLYLVASSYLNGITQSSTIASQLKLNARAVSTILKQYTITAMLWEDLQYLWKTLVRLEYQIKTGSIPDHQYRLQLKHMVTHIHQSKTDHTLE